MTGLNNLLSHSVSLSVILLDFLGDPFLSLKVFDNMVSYFHISSGAKEALNTFPTTSWRRFIFFTEGEKFVKLTVPVVRHEIVIDLSLDLFDRHLIELV